MRIAIVKPDWHIAGGFERVLATLVDALHADGHTVTDCSVDVPALEHAPFGIPVPHTAWDAQPEFFRYMAMVDAFRRLDVSAHDLVISTQPPSFAVEHPRQLGLFYHHHKVYYDLSDVYVASGTVDAGIHRQAESAVRAVDTPMLQRLTRILTPSNAVRDRLRSFNDITVPMDPFLAGPTVEPGPSSTSPRNEQPIDVVCVTRHEFAKRAELVVHAMHYVPDLSAVITGTGGRLPFARQLDSRLGEGKTDLDGLSPADIWCNDGAARQQTSPVPDSRINFAGQVGEAELNELYRRARCVVAPAYSEDYGLTAIEAMVHGKPLIVARDGGGLLDFVVDGVTGLVVEPTGRAIADAVRRIVDNPDLAADMGAAARERGREYTWERAFAQLRTSVALVMSS